MPLYIFSHPETGEIREVFFHMDDDKSYVDEDGIKWQREYSSPELNASGKTDPWNSKQFVEKTGKGRGKLGDMLDMSADLSKERASQNNGVDPMKENYYKRYSKERN